LLLLVWFVIVNEMTARTIGAVSIIVIRLAVLGFIFGMTRNWTFLIFAVSILTSKTILDD
jgi:hypothetical protein